MILLAAAAVAVGVGYARGGSLRRLADLPLKGIGLAAGAAALQLAIDLVNARGGPAARLAPSAHVLSWAMLLAMVWLNRRIPGMPVVGVGILLNALAVAANGGRMPISIDALERIGLTWHAAWVRDGHSLTYTAMDGTTRLALLGDIFPLGRPWPRPTVFSVGDAVLAAGLFALIPRAMVRGGAAR